MTKSSLTNDLILQRADQQKIEFLEYKHTQDFIMWLQKGMTMQLNDIRITLDPDYPDQVEIEMLEAGVGVEGGQFDITAFILAIKEFYNANY